MLLISRFKSRGQKFSGPVVVGYLRFLNSDSRIFFFVKKGAINKLIANLTEPSKINQIAVLIRRCFKLNKAEGFKLLYFTLGQIVRMKFSRTMLFWFLELAAIVSGCTNRDKVKSTLDYDRLYFDYAITAEEDAGYATCVFQFKEGGEKGKAVNIEPATVELDGQELETDSAKLSGFFYEVQKPIDSFAGKHLLVFTTVGGKEYKNEFEFSQFTLEKKLPEKMNRKSFSIQLKNFPATEKSVRLLLLDTAFESSGFNDRVPLVDGKITINELILKNVKKGPIILGLYIEQEIPLKQRTLAGGKISITYGLKKEFELTD
jgi:hypothetical protein